MTEEITASDLQKLQKKRDLLNADIAYFTQSRGFKTREEAKAFIIDWSYLNAIDAVDVATVIAFARFKEEKAGSCSPDSQSPFGVSWHEYYKNKALEWLQPLVKREGKLGK